MASLLEVPVAAPMVRKAGQWWWWLVPLGAAVAVYLLLALSLAYVKAPWCDEAWFVNPAYELAFHGRMASNVLEPSGHFLNAYLRGVQERTYIFPPNHLVGLAGWLRFFGFSALITRAYSICWSALALVAMFYVLLKLFKDRRVAQVATLFTAIDFVFLWSSADGRPEAMANALAILSVAAYLHLRERNLTAAVLVSQFFAAAGAFAHLNALLIVLSLIGMAWCLDRRRLRPAHVVFSALPYVFFAALWSLYILQRPSDFVAQFFPQAGYSQRWAGLLRPNVAIAGEINRHLSAYGADSLWAGPMSLWTIFVPLLYIVAVGWFLPRRKLDQTERAFRIFTVVLLCGMTFLNGFKAYFYLIYIIPIYTAILAAWLLRLWDRSGGGKWAACTIAAAIAVLQLSTSVQHIRADEYHRDYEPTVRALEQYRSEGKSIVGTAALGFGLNFTGFRDDIREGTYSHLQPDVLVLDRSYRTFAGIFETDEPHVFEHIVTTLSSRYRLVSQHGSFWILERVRAGSQSEVPLIDVSKVEAARKGSRAERLFQLISSEPKAHPSLARS